MNVAKLYCILFIFLIAGCQTAPSKPTLYEQLGGMPAIESIAGNFVYEIGYDQQIVKHFEETNLDRFYGKMIEHLCMVTDGPCEYTGDSMKVVHEGMDITEAEFNRIVELLINAMNRAEIPVRLQNRILARLAPLRGDIIYR